MAKFIVQYQWYENTSMSVIVAETKEQAIKEHVKLCSKLDCSWRLEKKYGYGGSISPFYIDWEDEEMDFNTQYNKFIEEYIDCFSVIELKEDLIGLITDKGLYNGENE